jgi:hypothetical protein
MVELVYPILTSESGQLIIVLLIWLDYFDLVQVKICIMIDVM